MPHPQDIYYTLASVGLVGVAFGLYVQLLLARFEVRLMATLDGRYVTRREKQPRFLEQESFHAGAD